MAILQERNLKVNMALEDEINALTDAELRARLEEQGKSVGPIVASTRALYRRMLLRILDGSNQFETPWESVADTEDLEFSDHEEFITQEAESSARTRHRQHSRTGDMSRELLINKSNEEQSKAVYPQFLIVILIVAILCLFVYFSN